MRRTAGGVGGSPGPGTARNLALPLGRDYLRNRSFRGTSAVAEKSSPSLGRLDRRAYLQHTHLRDVGAESGSAPLFLPQVERSSARQAQRGLYARIPPLVLCSRRRALLPLHYQILRLV